MNLHTEGSDVLLLELSGQMSLNESSLSSSSVTDEDELELNVLLRFHFLFGLIFGYGQKEAALTI